MKTEVNDLPFTALAFTVSEAKRICQLLISSLSKIEADNSEDVSQIIVPNEYWRDKK